MLGGREKVGVPVDLAMPALPKKNRRLTFPFGPACDGVDGRDTIHEHFIREIPLANGALGCALWDGGLVLTRWLYANGEAVFARAVAHHQQRDGANRLGNARNARVLELGCGVGLAGIMAAHFIPDGGEVVLTDYIPDALHNCRYNVGINHVDAADIPAELGKELRPAYDFAVAPRLRVAYLDWDAELRLHTAKCAAAAADVQAAEAAHAAQQSAVELPEGVALFAATPRSFDVILGAELTYNLLSCESLAHVVDKYLADDGVFHEVLSDDRDGVGVFIAHIERLGFATQRRPVPQEFVGNFGTRKWSRQNDETYSLYTWSRKAAAAAASE